MGPSLMRPDPGTRLRQHGAGVTVAALACWLVWGGPQAVAQERPALIAAAADLKFALAEIAGAFARETGQQVRITYGSSGDLARQIAQGAPFEMLLSADERHVFDLHRAGLTRGGGALYAIGRLAVFAPHGSPLKLDADLRGLQAAVTEGRVSRFAIANPQHAPYGRAAREVLERLGIWSRLQPALVLGENASQAMQFAASGSCQGGIVPLSLASAPEIAKLGTFERIPPGWHSPLRQRMVLVARAGPVAAAFYDYVQRAAAARQTLARFGFVTPEGK
jgi:molybdate transport system substrate-binding protein